MELGEHYLAEDAGQRLMTIEEFIDDFVLGRKGSAYLAQHNIFDQIIELRRDIDIPCYCFALPTEECSEAGDTESEVYTQIWFGPTGSYSPLHHDPHHNLLAQIVGELCLPLFHRVFTIYIAGYKYVRLYGESESRYLYPMENDNMSNNRCVITFVRCILISRLTFSALSILIRLTFMITFLYTSKRIFLRPFFAQVMCYISLDGAGT